MQGNVLVEQVNSLGDIVSDYDTSLSVKEIYERISQFFPNVFKDSDGMICGEYQGFCYALRVKNITYLGNPHPPFKKRIQIADDLHTFYRNACAKGRKPILLGIYTYRDNTVFCDFNIEDFVVKKAHNSSAHVYTSDIADATLDDIFQKVDAFGNRITVFSPDGMGAWLLDVMAASGWQGMQTSGQVRIPPAGTRQTPMQVRILPAGAEQMRSLAHGAGEIQMDYTASHGAGPVVECIRQFFAQVPVVWHGIDCYREMIAADYRNKFQPEWPGFYLEYLFEKFLKEQRLENLIRYAQDKRKGGIDLDLYFPVISCYGDLKAHSAHSRGIQGNDWGTVMSIIDAPGQNNHIFYVVCEHDTVKDSEMGYKVTEFWNRAQHKANLMSYSRRMKNRVVLRRAYILDIHAGNRQYLSMFKQGINSNGQLREPKIMIEREHMDKFVMAEMELGQ